MLVTKPLEDSLAGMTLLRMDLLVGLQDLVNDRDELPEFRFDARYSFGDSRAALDVSRIF